MNFKEYINNKIINESPMKRDEYEVNFLDIENVNHVKSLIQTNTPIKINIPNIPYTILNINEVNSSMIREWFINENYLIVSLICYKKIGNGIEINSSWQWKESKGFAFNLIFNYFLKKYDFVISGGLHSKLGENFWKKIIKYSEDNGYVVTILYKGNEIKSHDNKNPNINIFWDNIKYQNSKIKIYKNVRILR